MDEEDAVDSLYTILNIDTHSFEAGIHTISRF